MLSNLLSHYINNQGCRPSRADIQTGKSHYFHGVTQTDGFAKTEDEVTFIDPQKTPTIGNIMRDKEGYNTYYIGKQHFKRAPVENPEFYKRNDYLYSHGYSSWTVPDPHGIDPINSAFHKDIEYVEEAKKLIPHLKEPYYLCFSLVNPHDIVLWVLDQLYNTL